MTNTTNQVYTESEGTLFAPPCAPTKHHGVISLGDTLLDIIFPHIAIAF